ncbi:TRAP transporter small permease subunit [Marinomonas ostreistagni]|uniref:TRAP transporter small permease subunit n=1 Tax=Marinomonas ostreistagni TaxID=359209 RepID=UPI00195191A8|nr:TRAP transporter small permease subunit [Marinomonas ostreistagni]MBM6550097.1 TRAP transporter small permease subunit [Marinomonas ostreistagni]
MSTDIQDPNTDSAEMPHNLLDKTIVRVGNALSLLFLFTVAISFYEVVMRYVFNDPTTWVHETASFLGACLFVFGGIYALATNKHVRVVLVYDAVSERTRQYLNIFHHVMGLIFAGLLSYAAYQMTESAVLSPFGDIHFETSGSAWNPPFPAYVKIMIFLTMCVMTIQFVLHLIQEIRNLGKS